MTDVKISALPASTTPLAGTEVLPIVQSGATKQVTVANLTAGRAVSGSSFNATLSANSSVSTGYIHNNTGSGSGVGSKFALQSNGTDVATLSWLYNGSAFSTDIKGFGAVTLTPGNNGGGNTTVLTATTTDITFNTGNLIQGTAAKGINFTANTGAAGMTSQLLNWYEEGTWTPQYTNTTPPTTPYTMDIKSATYTRIGRQVTVRAYIATSNVNTTGASGELSISGLPFAPASGNAAYSAACVAEVLNWTTYPCFGYVAGDSKIYLEKRATSNGASANMVAGDLVAGATANQNLLMITATYFT